MNLANVKLSPAELSLANNAGFILTKNSIINKACTLMSAVAPQLQEQYKRYNHNLPEEVFQISPKIYKGEKYRELPYVMLDYPRYFKDSDIFAVRMMFWWGNHFSITLQLSGKYADQFGVALLEKLDAQQDGEWFFCVANDQWEHHFEADNYQPLKRLKFQEQIQFLNQNKFLKIARRVPLDKWDEVVLFYCESNEYLLQTFANLK